MNGSPKNEFDHRRDQCVIMAQDASCETASRPAELYLDLDISTRDFITIEWETLGEQSQHLVYFSQQEWYKGKI